MGVNFIDGKNKNPKLKKTGFVFNALSHERLDRKLCSFLEDRVAN